VRLVTGQFRGADLADGTLTRITTRKRRAAGGLWWSQKGDDRGTVPWTKEHGMTASGIIMAIVIGAIIGALARFVLPGRQNIGILLTIVIGIVAALLGTWLAQLVGVAVTDGIDWIEIVFQVGLAAIAIALFAGVGSRRSV
jgi:uncharacterized membrane protein YeaQ/YmgE (transglycosylase-associated protein family)